MEIVQMTPETMPEPEAKAFLPAGLYGPGLENEADVDLVKFEYPAVNKPCPFAKDKDWVAANPTRHNHAYFCYRIVTPDGKMIWKDRWVRNDWRLKKELLAHGVTLLADRGKNNYDFAPSDVAPRPLAGIELGEASEYNGEMQTGFVNKVHAK